MQDYKPQKPLTNQPENQETLPERKKLLEMLFAIVLSAVIFGSGGFYLGTQNSRPSSTLQVQEAVAEKQVQSSPSPAAVEKTINSQTLIDLRSTITTETFEVTDRPILKWVSDDNWTILVKEAQSIGLEKANAHKELQDPKSETSQLVDTISAYFASKGFTQSSNNSSTSATDETFYDYIRGFENRSEKCLLSVNPDQVPEPTVNISCSESFETSYDEQIPFVKALNDRVAGVYILAKTETAARASISWRRTGVTALFSKQNGTWELIHSGQDQPSCQLLEDYDFPKEISESCYE